MEIMTSTEIAAQELNKQEKLVEAERLRHDVSGILGKFINKKLPSNLTKDQQIALKDLRNEPELKVVPFDKGVGFVLIEKDEMIRKISNELGEAKVISKDPTNALVKKVQSKISQLHKDKKISKSLFYQMYPSDATPPRMYGMIKAHKPEKNFPMRTVVSTIGTATYGAAKFLVDVFQPTLNKNEIRVINTTSFVEEAKDWHIDPDEVQCSFDVVALYPSIPIKKAIAAMIDLINNDIDDVRQRTELNVQDIKSLLELCLSKCYFLWNDLLYQIDDAGPIGLSLMVVVAEGYLQVLEKQAIESSLHTVGPKTYRRYVDDSHARFQSPDHPEQFLQILNAQDEKIQYTIELENSNAELSFLDVTVQNDRQGSYNFNVHRKKAITNLQIKPTSSVNPELVKGVFKGFLVRAKRLCSSQYIQQEIKFLIDVFVENGHNREQLAILAEEMTNDQSVGITTSTLTINDDETATTLTANDDQKPTVTVPWIPILGPRLRKAMRRRGVRTIFTSGRNLSSLLCNHKSALPPNSFPGVYRLTCGCGHVYIGETKKRIRSRISEHEKDVFHGRWSNSGASEHASTCRQDFNWEEAETLCVESNFRRRKIRESLEIRKHKRSDPVVVNRDQGGGMSTGQWNCLLGKLKIIDD